MNTIFCLMMEQRPKTRNQLASSHDDAIPGRSLILRHFFIEPIQGVKQKHMKLINFYQYLLIFCLQQNKNKKSKFLTVRGKKFKQTLHPLGHFLFLSLLAIFNLLVAARTTMAAISSLWRHFRPGFPIYCSKFVVFDQNTTLLAPKIKSNWTHGGTNGKCATRTWAKCMP